MSFNIVFYLHILCLLIVCLAKINCDNTAGKENEDSKQKPKAGRTSKFLKIPRLVVIQADGVIWPYKVEKDVVGPFAVLRTDVLHKQMEGYNMRTPMNTKIVNTYKCQYEIRDNTGKLIKLFEGVKEILLALKKNGTKLALAETTTEGATLLHLIKLCKFDVFKFVEVDDDSEMDHIKRIQTRAEVDFQDMVYFGTNETFLKEVQNLNAIAVKINKEAGLKIQHIDEANTLYAAKHIQM